MEEIVRDRLAQECLSEDLGGKPEQYNPELFQDTDRLDGIINDLVEKSGQTKEEWIEDTYYKVKKK